MELPVVQPIINQLYSWFFTDQTVVIVVGVFVIVIGLSLWGARRMETD